MNNNDLIDESSAISVEEQQEIIADINNISEKNRQALSSASANEGFKAKRKGGIFPLAINIIAVVFLAVGFFLLSTLHGKDDVRLREGTVVLNAAERALINQIRQDTLRGIEEKENEIEKITAKMAETDTLLSELHSSNLELTAEQRATENNLIRMQEEYRRILAGLQDERANILENARLKEAALYAQLEARTSELAAVSQQKDAALNAAQLELERLGSEQARAAAIEAQLGAYLASADDKIRIGKFDEASSVLGSMVQFLNTPSFQGIRSFKEKKEFYARAVAVLESLISEARKNQDALLLAGMQPAANTDNFAGDLAAENARLLDTIANLNKSLAAANSGSAGIAQRLTELESSVSAQRNINTMLESSIKERDKTITELKTQNADLNQTLGIRDNEIKALKSENAEQAVRIEQLTTRLAAMRDFLNDTNQ